MTFSRRLLIVCATLAAIMTPLLAGEWPGRERVSEPLSKIDDAKYERAFKLTVEPCFRSPVIVELLLNKEGAGIVRVFRTWGKAGYYDGEVEIFLERATYPEDFTNFSADTVSEVMKMPDAISEDALDADTFTLELRSGMHLRKITLSGVQIAPLPSMSPERLNPQVRAFAVLAQDLLGVLAVYPCERPTPTQ